MSAFTEKERLAYQADGFVIRRNQFTHSLMARVNRALDVAEKELLAAASIDGRAYAMDGRPFVDIGHRTLQFEFGEAWTEARQLRVVEPIADCTPLLDWLVRTPQMTRPIQSILSCERLSLWTDKLNFKAAGGTGFEWHQDAPYWTPVSDSVADMPNVMVALDQASEASGCLRGIRGSHLGGAYPGKQDGSPLAGFYTDPVCFDLTAAVNFEVNAGDLIFFDPFLVHGSTDNNTSNRRRALIVTYQPADQPSLKSGRVINL